MKNWIGNNYPNNLYTKNAGQTRAFRIPKTPVQNVVDC